MPSHPGIKHWADQLDHLLQEAAFVKGSGNMAGIVGVQVKLREFKDNSPGYADPLDTQATLAIFDLDLVSTEEAVAQIKERSAKVAQLSKLIAGIAEEANAKADVLHGKLAIDAINAATSAISSFKKLRDELSNANAGEKEIATAIDGVLASIQGLRNKLENPRA